MIRLNSLDIGFGGAQNKDALFAPFGVNRETAIAAYDPTGQGDLRAVQYMVAMDRFMAEPARFVASVFASEDQTGIRVSILLCGAIDAQQVAGSAACNRDSLCLRYGEGQARQ